MRRALTALVVCACCAACRSAERASISERIYREKLVAIRDALDNADLNSAQRAARELVGRKITSSAGEFEADPSLLEPLIATTRINDAKHFKPRIRALVKALDQNSAQPGTAVVQTEDAREKLERFRQDESVSAPRKDGEISGGEILESGAYRAIRQAAIDLWHWLDKVVTDIFKWLSNMIKSLMPATGVGGFSSTFFTVGVIALAGGAVVLIVWALRKSADRKRPPKGVAEAGPAPSAKDADPTSREASEWEEYAQQLAAAGRHREAIRACYHAILAALFGAGILHYRKGRTNWEYCYTLSADVPWRERFFDLTGFFEVEWYGKYTSAPEDYRTYSSATQQFLTQARGKTRKREEAAA